MKRRSKLRVERYNEIRVARCTEIRGLTDLKVDRVHCEKMQGDKG